MSPALAGGFLTAQPNIKGLAHIRHQKKKKKMVIMIRLELDDLHCSIFGLCSESFKMYKLVRMVHNPFKGSQSLKFANFLLCSLNTHTHFKGL